MKRALNADLAAQALPVKQQAGLHIGTDFPALAAVAVGIECETAAAHIRWRIIGAMLSGAAIANAYAAMLMMFLELQNSPKIARPFLDAAEAAAGGATDREKRTVSIARRCSSGR